MGTARVAGGPAIGVGTFRELVERGGVNDRFTAEDRVRFSCDHACVVKLPYDAARMLSQPSGASSRFSTPPMQRFMRDVHAGPMQLVANWDEHAEAYGRVRMGVEPDSQMW